MGKDEIFRYSYEDMLRELDGLWHRYPGKMRMELLGWSADGRGILEVILGKKDAGRHVLIQAGMHGREYMNCAVVVRMVEEYLKLEESKKREAGKSPEKEKCGTEKFVEKKKNEHRIFAELEKQETEMPGRQKNRVETDVCFHIIPMVNPDGVMLSQYGTGMIRTRELKKQLKEWCEKEEKTAGERWTGNAGRRTREAWIVTGISMQAGMSIKARRKRALKALKGRFRGVRRRHRQCLRWRRNMR